jgi:hypothetical protein
MCRLGTWFVSGICVWIPCIKETTTTMMMMMIIIMYWVRALTSPIHLGLKTGPLCLILWCLVRAALFLYQSSRLPHTWIHNILRAPKKKEPRYACLSEAKCSHSHRTGTDVSSWVPQLKFAATSGSKKGTQICMSKNPQNFPVREPPSVFPQQGLYGESCSVSRAIGLFIPLYLSGVLKKTSNKVHGKHKVTVHGAPRHWFHLNISVGIS